MSLLPSQSSLRIILLLILASSAFACASGKGPRKLSELDPMNPRISISQIPIVKVKGAKLDIDYKPRVSLGEIRDDRSDPVLLEFEGKEIESQGDVQIVVRYVLQKALRLRGISLEKEAPLILETSITSWNAEIVEDKVLTEAVVVGDLIAPGGVSIYSGVYEGFDEVVSPELLERDVQRALGKAMHQALTNLILDESLLEYLAAY